MEKQFPIVIFGILAVGLYVLLPTNTFDELSVRGKRVLVTGISDITSEHVAYEYSKLGAKILLAGHNEVQLRRVTNKCRTLGAEKVDFIVSNLKYTSHRRRLIQETERILQGIDHIVINHGTDQINWWIGSTHNLTTELNDINDLTTSYVDIASMSTPFLSQSRGSIGVVSTTKCHPRTDTDNGTCFLAANTNYMHGIFSTLRQQLERRGTDVSVTLCYLGPLANRYPKTSISCCDNYAKAAEKRALAIIAGLTNRAYEVYHPWTTTISALMDKFFPASWTV